ncbi:MAG: DUF4388 domain-containing protein [Anaerolineae bacterium]|jgi:DNA-binding PadR family transcriptional regulator
MATPTTTKTDLLLLGLLLDRPMHGYDLYQQIQSEGIDRWFNISAAGVYYSLRKLRDQGWVIETRQPGGGSSRKLIHRLTDEGRSAFFAAMENELASHEDTCLDYDLVIYLLNRFPWQRAIPQLEVRQAFLKEQMDKVTLALDTEQGDGSRSLTRAILDHKLRFLEMEQEWLTSFIHRLRAEGDTTSENEVGSRLMVLDGSLSNFHLPDLVHLIISGRHSGTLSVTDGADTHMLVFQEGQPVAGGHLERGKLASPVASCEEVMEGLCELFRWRDGRFTFAQRVERPEWSVDLKCSAEELILRGCRKVDSWDIIQQLVPTADTIFEIDLAGRMEGLELTALERQVAAAVDGVSDVATIARELDRTLFETSRTLYCLTAIGALRTADVDKIRLRRVFREIAELMCRSTQAWRQSPDDRSCEEEVNDRVVDVPIHLDKGRVMDQVDPQLDTDELRILYHGFLQTQYQVISRRFGQTNARQAFEQAFRNLSPELQGIAKRYGFEGVSKK